MSIASKLILAASLVFSIPTFAADLACGRFLPCGTFEGNATDIDAPHDLVGTETMTLTAAAGNTLTMEGKLTLPDGKIGWSYKFNLVFDADGNFKVERASDQSIGGYGRCSGGVCPHFFTNIPGYGTSGILSFDGKAIHRTQINQNAQGELSGISSTLKLK